MRDRGEMFTFETGDGLMGIDRPSVMDAEPRNHKCFGALHPQPVLGRRTATCLVRTHEFTNTSYAT